MGTTKICALIAEVAGAIPEILGAGLCPSQGVRRGLVVDIEEASTAIGVALRRAEEQSGFKVMSAFVGISGHHILSTRSYASVSIRHPHGVISPADVARVTERARIVQLPADQEILHVLPWTFAIDGLGGVQEPVGLVGRRLEVEANIVTGSVTPIHNVIRCVESLGVDLDAVVLGPLAAGWAVLSVLERDVGALVIDFGGEATGAALFRGGGMLHAWALPVGGAHVTNDLAFGLRTSFAVAEELKIRHGSTVARARPEGEGMPVKGTDGTELWIDQRTIADIIDARISETFELVQAEMARGGFGEAYPAGVVVTGGSALLPGTSELAADIFGVPARIGWPGEVKGVVDEVRTPDAAAAVGLLAWGREQIRESEPTMASGPARLVAGIVAWLRDLLG